VSGRDIGASVRQTPAQQVAHARPPVSGTASVFRDGAFPISAGKITMYGNVTDTACPGMDQNFLARTHASTIHQSLPGRSAETSDLDIHGAFRRAAASDLTCRPKLEFCQCSMH
jgi:hypothetical protein